MERLVVWHRAVPRARGVADPSALAAWSKAVAARFSAAGGTVLAHLSGTAVACFEAGDIADVLDLALDLLDEADDGPLAVSFGAGVSALEERGGVLTGAAIEAAEALAVRAHAGEVVLDPAARERARGLFLFARQVGAGSGAAKAASVDRTHPRRDSCALAMARLGAVPLAPATEALLPALESALRDPGSLTVLRGPVGAGTIELVRAAQKHLAPSHVVDVGGASLGVAPLASFRAALARDADLRALVAAAPEASRAPIEAAARGELPSLEDLVVALASAVDTAHGPVWLFLNPLSLVDAGTLALVARVHRARPQKLALVVRHAVDAPLPALLGDPRRVELTLPSLRTGDARVIAEAVLGDGTATDVARRVAVLGGDTPLGVLEAARAMIGSGDLVLVDDHFAWRSTPRGGVRALALDVLIAERLELLDDESRRVLEAIAVMPDDAPRALVDAVCASDGVRPRSIARGVERLAREGWLDPSGGSELLRPTSSFVRRFVVSAVPPARAAELHRFVAAALEARARAAEAEPLAIEAERGLQLLEGGREDEAAPMLVRIARLALDGGHTASAGQLALVVLRSAATGEGRALAQGLARELAVVRAEGDLVGTGRGADPITLRHRAVAKAESEPERVSEPDLTEPLPLQTKAQDAPAPEPIVDARVEPATQDRPIPPESDDESDLVGDVRDAIRRRDFVALERLAERAIAEGSDMAAVARLRALAEALRGDLAGAQRRLDRARAQKAPRDRRALLAEAMVALRASRVPAAVRLSLSALADARRAADERGEAAALFTLAACFRALGRHNDAALLESRVDA